MEKKRRNLLILLGVVAFAILFRLAWFELFKILDCDNPPPIEKGVLDLREFKFKDNKTLKLNGQWEFYPEHFYYQHHNRVPYTTYAHVPGPWGQTTYGTYRLKVLLAEDQAPLSLSIENVKHAYKLYINGDLILESGLVSRNIETHQSYSLPQYMKLENQGDNLEIVLEVSNYKSNGGIFQPIRLGLEQGVNLRRNISIILQFAVMVFYLGHAFYALTLYFLGLKNRGLIYFALTIIFALTSFMLSDDKLLLKLLEPSYLWSMKLPYLVYNFTMLFLPLVMYFLLDKNINKKYIYGFSAIALAYSYFIIFGSLNLVLSLSKILVLTMLMSIGLTIYMVVVSMTKKENLFYLLIATIFLATNIIFSIIKTNTHFGWIFYPFDLIFALGFFSSFWLKRYADNATKVRELANRELMWLQSQMPPHFIFNTLTSIASLSYIDIDKMRVLLDKFSDYLRFSMDFRNAKPLVHINQELELIESYLYIENERFGDRLNVLWDLDEGLNFLLPPLTIQPLVENSVKHGIRQNVDGVDITIRIKNNKDHYFIMVEDNGPGMSKREIEKVFSDHSSDPEEKSGIGIKNVKNRLKNLFDENLVVESVKGQGTSISFVIGK